jgi:hypothetical protein
MLIKVGVLRNEYLASFQQENSSSFESAVEVQCMELVAAIEARKAQLLDFVRQEREMRLRALREQMTLCTARLQQTTALLQFCIEALKETDSVSFLQVSALFFFMWCRGYLRPGFNYWQRIIPREIFLLPAVWGNLGWPVVKGFAPWGDKGNKSRLENIAVESQLLFLQEGRVLF